ncbi:hypothetical protein [Mycobacterium haemophilum]|uniref:Uncharacterized protein n=1 Tax=Mycobacterium haemophilum TaxID=29311 RepID=A0A0I9TWE0_9MYCO|nr:hypothetical protein [Mycobacterium haemophilum]AKN17183.1 hypothetical protein B586_12440 [Mycobacterium haemophilum DSM 44634]KLO32885.1 hypothetical protein ABH39_05025 [Mycobacterium haemophilum]KLO37189.1 hypothetical protein ABH38_09865 [Mycobacterium haemophilum]KLO43661.1 hypothetical protein ABH37_07390 [Mycobacterium haemophilum]KLO56020.1 hypothetical protein ABH36_04540 [Mycobacterium haemophilum]
MVIPYLPSHATRFVGREVETNSAPQLLADNQVVTLTGADVVAQTVDDFCNEQWHVDPAPTTDQQLEQREHLE